MVKSDDWVEHEPYFFIDIITGKRKVSGIGSLNTWIWGGTEDAE